jgi:4-amino-4-deoxy-L-arabinose transferase-like glycosyltransferase
MKSSILKIRFLNRKKIPGILSLAIILVITFVVRIPFLNEPLDRDVGLFAAIGREIANGAIHYKDITDNKPPGIHFIFALLYKIVGSNFIAVNFLAVILALVTTLFIYFVSKRLFDRKTAIVSSLLFGIFSSSPHIEGSIATTENFMILPLIIMFFFFIKAEDKYSWLLYFLSGVFAGIALCFKQIALFDFFGILAYLVILTFILSEEHRIKILLKKIILLLMGFILLPVIFIIYFKIHNALNDFLYSVFIANFKYISLLGYRVGYLNKFFNSNIKFAVNHSILLIGALTFILMTGFIFIKNLKAKQITVNQKIILLSSWIIFSFLGVCFPARFFPHYYIQILPSFSIATGYVLVNIFFKRFQFQTIRGMFILVCVISSFLYSLFVSYRFYFVYKPEEISVKKYQWEPFVETRDLGYYIRYHSHKDDYIYVWADEPEIYYYSDRRSPSKYLNNCQFTYFKFFSLYTEKDLVKDLKQKIPVYIIIDSKYLSVLSGLQDLSNFVKNNYVFKKEFKVIRENVWGYSLLLYGLKQ